MTVIVQRRKCFGEYEVDVLTLAGRSWRRCPHCERETESETLEIEPNEEEQTECQ